MKFRISTLLLSTLVLCVLFAWFVDRNKLSRERDNLLRASRTMEYDDTYNLHCTIPLDSGRTVTLRDIDQQQTYWGLLGGYPAKKSNDRKIDFELKEITDNCSGTPYLIPPKRRPYFQTPGDYDGIDDPSRPAEWLPMVRCFATLEFSTAKDHTKDASYLTVVWFQDEFALPIAPGVMLKIKAVDWESLATDVGF